MGILDDAIDDERRRMEEKALPLPRQQETLDAIGELAAEFAVVATREGFATSRTHKIPGYRECWHVGLSTTVGREYGLTVLVFPDGSWRWGNRTFVPRHLFADPTEAYVSDHLPADALLEGRGWARSGFASAARRYARGA
jgi:hypothetical protein